MVREDRREGCAGALAAPRQAASDDFVEIVNFLIAMLIAGLLTFVIIDVLARSLATDASLPGDHDAHERLSPDHDIMIG
jgi:hypothetical protein